MDKDEIREEFSPLLDGELSDEERAALQKRLGEDAEALRELDGLKRVDALYRGLARKSAPEGFEKQVRAALQRRPVTIRFRRGAVKAKPLWPVLTAVAALLLMSAAVFYQVSNLRKAPGSFVVSMRSQEETPRKEPLEAADRELKAAREAEPQPSAEPAVSTENVETSNGVFDRMSNAAQPAPAVQRGRGGFGGGAFGGRVPLQPPAPEKTGKLEAPLDTLAESDAAPGMDESAPAAVVSDRERVPPSSTAQPTAAAVAGAEVSGPETEGPSPELSLGQRWQIYSDEVKEDLVREVEAKEEIPTPAPASPADKPDARALGDWSFVKIENEWREHNYAGEQTTPLARDSETIERILKSHPDLAPILDWSEAVVFHADGTWYRLDAADE